MIKEHLKHIGPFLLFLGICCFAFWIRILATEIIPPDQFMGNDSYFYYD